MTKSKILLRLTVLLLLMMAGANEAWGWGETVYYLQNYNTSDIDWSTNTDNRFTPIIVNDGGNLYLAADPTQTYNNGATLTGPDMHVPAGADFLITFDLKLGNSNDQKPKFWINGANGNDMFTVEAQYTNGDHPWIINGYTDYPITLSGTNYQNTSTINDRPWFHFKLTSKNGTLHLIIENDANPRSVLLDHDIEILNTTGGIGRLMFWSGKALAKFAIDNIRATSLFSYDAASATVPLTAVGTLNHSAISGLPTIINETGSSGTITYSSSNTSVAQVDNSGNVYLVGTGTTGIIATMGSYTTSYELTVTGSNATTTTTTSISSGITTKTWALTGEGVMPRGGVANLGAITMSYGIDSEMGVALNDGGTYVMKVVDANGYSHAAINGTTHLPDNASYGGTYYTFRPAANGTLTINGKLNKPRLYNSDGTELVNNDNNETSVTANLTANNVYYFYCEPWERALLSSFSYSYQAYLTKNYDVVPSTQTSYGITSVEGLSSPTYSIISTAGEITMGDVYMSGNTVYGFSGKPGAIKVRISEGATNFDFVLTVAYPATPYPGKLWDFNQYYESEYQPPLSIDENGYSGGGFPRIDANSNGTVIMTDGGPSTITDEHGDTWVAELKNVNYGSGRDARWRHVNAVHGDNAFIVSETAGLVFNTGGKGFFVRNDRVKYNCWGHVGIRQNGASFTIPQLAAGDIVEINWKRESGGAGGEYTATNVTDLRYKPVSEQFEITGSQNGTTGGVLDVYKNPGYTSFIATGGDVTFTLHDGGATDILSIRIYSGGYRSTMRTIQDTYHRAPETSMLLDYQDDEEHNYNYQEYEYDYCNVLNSTNTGPAFYVLKGYRQGEDNVECVTGSDAVRGFEADGITPRFILHQDNDATYPAYPVSAEESTRLYNLRKNLVGFRMYNHQWQSQRNSYNNGRIGAQGGWGKVTIRMNNYTNDMKYVIGYTNDVTMTFGSRPHQLYPYTWDFTNISAQAERGAATNAYNTIKDEDLYETNWNNTGKGVLSLDIENAGQYGSQYVPGAVLVATDRALSKVTYYDNGGVLRTLGLDHALDELDGLGVNGKISFDSDQQLPPTPSRQEAPRRAGTGTVSLLSLSMDNYKVVKTSVEIEGETIVTDWQNTTNTYLAAGNGWVKFGADRITETSIAACGFAYKCDFNESESDRGIYLRPARKIKNGDVITVKLYATSTPNGNNFGLCIYPENISTASATLFISSGLKNTEETLSYTVTAGDGLADQSMIMLYRNTDKSVYLSEVQITGDASSEPVRREIFCETQTTLTIPEVNAGGKQDWIYVSASDAPTAVVNATLVSTGTDGPDANTDHDVYKYKVTAAGDAYLTFAMNTRIYKIGVTHILKEIHPVGGTGWATEIRDRSIDHSLTGYFTKNDVNAYTVGFDSYDLTTATVALTPILEDGYVPELTGMVLRLDNVGGLTDANTGKYVPLFSPSYTRAQTSTAVDFPDHNWMYNNPATTEINNQNYNEVFYNPVGNNINYTKFVLTNVHWKYSVTIDNGSVTDKQWEAQDNAAAAGFRRLHIWSTTDVTPNLSASEVASRNTMPANTAFLCVPTEQLPVALWGTFPPSSSRLYTLGIRELDNETTDLTAPRDDSQGNGDMSQCWYTLNGTKLSAPPTKAGIYICGGRKVVIK